MSSVTVTPGRMTLADWAAIWRGAGVTIDPVAKPDVDAAAQTVDDLIASGRAVYGLNTGFGKLAQPRCRKDWCCRMPPVSAMRCPKRSCA